jgi:hypothetical protein
VSSFARMYILASKNLFDDGWFVVLWLKIL